jgi:pilus assembly protein Flp/PilA
MLRHTVVPNRASMPGRARVRGYLALLAASVTRPLRRDDRGATAVEYGLIVALIAAVIAVVVGLLGQQVSSAFSNMVNAF